jgi:protein-S-isoprenylcysteine O-methyltransferase Ste14
LGSGERLHSQLGVPDLAMLRLGGWFFRNRGWLPLPWLGLLIFVGPPSTERLAFGLVVSCGGELLRLFAVAHIGPASRTRGSSLGELCRSGPYAWVRNPLYIGNLLIWLGVFCSSPSLPRALLGWAWFCIQYHLIVLWEESQWIKSEGSTYFGYLSSVPRWFPSYASTEILSERKSTEILRSESKTLAAFVGIYLILFLQLLFQ